MYVCMYVHANMMSKNTVCGLRFVVDARYEDAPSCDNCTMEPALLCVRAGLCVNTCVTEEDNVRIYSRFFAFGVHVIFVDPCECLQNLR